MKQTTKYYWVTFWLMVLLVLTIIVSMVNLGPLAPLVALIIASTKAILVILYFMHVLEQPPLVKFFVSIGFFWLAILIGLTLSDYLTRTYPIL